MRDREKYFVVQVLLLFILLVGCAGEATEVEGQSVGETESGQEVVDNVEKAGTEDEAEETQNQMYESAMENGLRELEKERYEQATVYFEVALVEQADDARAKALLEQTGNYIKATDLFNQEAYEEARTTAEVIQTTENGSDNLINGASQLIGEIEAKAAAKTEEAKAIEAAEKEAEESEKEVETHASEPKNKEQKESAYEYSDFVGYYLHFDSEDQSHSDMILTIGHKYITIGWWKSEFELYEIIEASVNENRLTIDYYLQPYGEGEGTYGTMTLSLVEENGEKHIDFGTGFPFYKTTYDGAVSYDYTIQDFLLEDMNQ